MSGGVDSAVAALLLKRAGHQVVGIHLRTGVKEEPGASRSPRPRCCGADEAADARRVCALLDIPFYVQNTEREFRGLISAFADAYARGETPNPCVACNQEIKFGALLERARALGADAVATGHYVRRVREGRRWAVARAADRDKDQSYVLYGLRQPELERARFPLGDLEKGEVRRLARQANLPVAEKPESQEICFVPSGDYRDLVRTLRPDAFLPGAIVDLEGRRLGDHPGIGAFTVGQRKGLGVAGGEPLYVLRLEPETRRVVVGSRSSLGVGEALVEDVRWTGAEAPARPIAVHAVLRYRADPFEAMVEVEGEGLARLSFANAAWPVTPGQAAVFYKGDVVLGGGRIRSCS
jgi:tRNA-specific 2-thiouridylase